MSILGWSKVRLSSMFIISFAFITLRAGRSMPFDLNQPCSAFVPMSSERPYLDISDKEVRENVLRRFVAVGGGTGCDSAGMP